jgi:transcriptional regulator with XRE-family HTH domain
MNTIEALRADCAGWKRGRIEELADAMAISRSTFRKIISGETRNPRYDTVQKIESFRRRAAMQHAATRHKREGGLHG